MEPMSDSTLPNWAFGPVDSDEFETLVEGFIEHRSGADDRLPFQTFFELLAEQQAYEANDICFAR